MEEVLFQCGGYTNPVCQASAYKSTLLSLLPGLHSLDGKDVIQAPAQQFSASTAAVPSLWAIHHSYPALQIPDPPQVPQDHHSGPSNHNLSPRQRNFQGRRHDESIQDSKMTTQAAEQREYSKSNDDGFAKSVFQQGASGNAEDLIDAAVTPLWKQETSSEDPDNSRYVRFVGKSCTKSTLTTLPHLRRLTVSSSSCYSTYCFQFLFWFPSVQQIVYFVV